MIRAARNGAFLLAALSLCATPAFAEDIADICPTTGDIADTVDYYIFAAQAFVDSEHASGGEYLASITEGALPRTPPANGADVALLHDGAFGLTSTQTMMHMTVPGDALGDDLIPLNRIVILRTRDVQGLLALTPCGGTYFATWTTPNFLADFVWPDPADLN
jgi:hypothetical protein